MRKEKELGEKKGKHAWENKDEDGSRDRSRKNNEKRLNNYIYIKKNET